jgi:riboflavin-specific deaminase-like protein
MSSPSVTNMNLNQQIERWFTSSKNKFTSKKRPFVTLAYAQSLDGSITTRRGEGLALSGTESTQITHQLRSLHDGILVGIETVLTDDPQLTVREWNGANPQPIVLDSLLRMPHGARICQHPDKRCWILTVRSATADSGLQAEILTLDKAEQERVPLINALQLLHDMGINSLMVEGGATVITAFLKARLADALVLTIAPIIVGGYKAVSNLGINSLEQLPRIQPMYTESLGNDVIVWGDLQYNGEKK